MEVKMRVDTHYTTKKGLERLERGQIVNVSAELGTLWVKRKLAEKIVKRTRKKKEQTPEKE